MKKKLLTVLVLSQVFFVSASYSETLRELGLIDKSQHAGISCIRHQINDCFVSYQTGVCLVEIKYYSNENSQLPDYTKINEVNMTVASGVNPGSPDELRNAAEFLTDGASRAMSRAATLNDFNVQKNKLNQYLNSGNSSNDKLPQCVELK
jgi:hypothetical protein